MSQLGARWGRLPSKSGGTLYVHRSRESDVWRAKALFHSGESLQWRWRVDYDDFVNEFPQRMRLRSADGRVDLGLRVSQLDLDVSLGPTFFEVALAPNARRVSPDSLEDGEILSLAGQ